MKNFLKILLLTLAIIIPAASAIAQVIPPEVMERYMNKYKPIDFYTISNVCNRKIIVLTPKTGNDMITFYLRSSDYAEVRNCGGESGGCRQLICPEGKKCDIYSKYATKNICESIGEKPDAEPETTAIATDQVELEPAKQHEQLSYLCGGKVRALTTGPSAGPNITSYARMSDGAEIAYGGERGIFTRDRYFNDDFKITGSYSLDEDEFCGALKD